jgi:predicted RNA-binding protein associated with RNAse of E/G family
MRKQPHFRAGQTILFREIWQDRVWSARPEIVVQDRPELTASYLPHGTLLKQPRTPDGGRVTVENRVRAEWVLQDVEWVWGGRLRLSIPGSHYSVLIFRNPEDGSQQSWYINLEDTIRCTVLGYDYIDQLLDIILSPDLSTWHWKDENELDEAVRFGLITAEKAAAMRTEGKKTVKWLQSGISPFNGWEDWRPNPSWQIPTLPVGWDIIE